MSRGRNFIVFCNVDIVYAQYIRSSKLIIMCVQFVAIWKIIIIIIHSEFIIVYHLMPCHSIDGAIIT